ncbi:MAG: DedA family protein [Bacteroidetes bacterium]|jgi:membrane protein DedA with SNARE-associated domain|nr:DedA family protein [Bacteroidota bacterium]
MTDFISNSVIEIIRYLGYPGVFLLMTLESVNIPIPSEVIMPFSGFLAMQGTFNFWAVASVGTLGNVAGSLLSYFLAEWILKMRNRYGLLKIILSDKHLEKTNSWFLKYGSYSIFFGRVVPVVRTFISLPAGIGKMNPLKFTYLTFLGSFLWSLFLTYVGFFLGNNWVAIQVYFRKIDYAVLGITVVIILYLIFGRRKKKIIV